MKMTKLLATFAAASLAVTSLAAVASAEEVTKEFNMGNSVATYKGSGSYSYLVDNSDGVFTVGQTSRDRIALDLSSDADLCDVTGVSMKVEGTQASKVQEGLVTQTKNLTQTFKFVDDGSITGDVKGDDIWNLLVLEDTIKTCTDGYFACGMFYTIDKITLTVDVEWTTAVKSVYETLNNNGYPGTFCNIGALTHATANAGEVSDLLDLALAFGGITYGLDANGNSTNGYNYGVWTAGSLSTILVYPILGTTGGTVQNRYAISLLSDTKAWNSDSANGDGSVSGTTVNQTVGYDANQDIYFSMDPYHFAGFASQVADFFNKQSNGTITFNLTAPAASGSGLSWTVGGIPSTEVGFNFVTVNDVQTNDIALFFNYNATTGSMVSYGAIDKTNAAVTFTIDNILDDFGGYTKANLQDIYYGLSTAWGVTAGIIVEKVTLAYDTAADEDDDDDDDIGDVIVDDDDDDDDDDDTPVIVGDDDDDDDDDSNVDAGNDIVSDDDDDTNPGTGVALAVIPAMIAGAAAIVAKKRK